jgi:hypothetical protein
MNDQLQLALGDRRDGQEANLAAGTTTLRDERAVIEEALALLTRNRDAHGQPRAFTADNVHHLVEHELGPIYDRNRVSSCMGIWAAHGRIVEDDQRAIPSTHRPRKGSRNRWWRGTITAPPPRTGD